MLFQIKEADRKAQNPEYAYRLEELKNQQEAYERHLSQGICLSIKDLKINGKLLMDMGYQGEQIGFILKNLLEDVTEEKVMNETQNLVDFISHNYK